MAVDAGVDVLAEAPQKLTDQQRQQNRRIPSPGKSGTETVLCIGGIHPFFQPQIHPQHDEKIDQLRADGRRRRTLRAHRPEAQLAENEDVVETRIGQRGADTGIERQGGFLHAPEQGRQHGRTGNGQEGPGDDGQVACRRL